MLAVEGTPRTVVTTDPVAGAELPVTTVPAGSYWVLQAISVALTTFNSGVPRTPTLILDDGTNTLAHIGPAANVPINNAQIKLSWMRGPKSSWNGGNRLIMPLPDFPLGPGYRISFVTVNLDATNDNYGPASISIVEYVGSFPIK